MSILEDRAKALAAHPPEKRKSYMEAVRDANKAYAEARKLKAAIPPPTPAAVTPPAPK